MPPPVAVNVVAPPGQTLVGIAESEAVITLIVADAEPEHPFASVIVTLYKVVVEGLTLIVAVFPGTGLH